MADTKLSALTELAAAPAEADEIYIRDESEAPSAESKRITLTNLRLGVLEIANLTELAAAADETDEFFISDAGTIKRISVANARTTILEIANLTELAAAPAITDELFISDAGTIKRISLTNALAVPVHRGALVYDVSDQTITNNTWTAVNFDTEVYDTDTIHDTSTNNTRFTIPTGITRVRLSANIRFTANDTEQRGARFQLNGSDFIGQAEQLVHHPDSTNASMQNISSGVIDCVATNYFELEVYQNSSGNLDLLGDSGIATWFSIEIIQ